MSVEDMEYPKSQLSPPLKKIQSTSFLNCCFGGAVAEEEPPMVAASLLRSSSSWIRAKVGELPDIREWYIGMLAGKGESSRQGCGEFRYDALSYALNFDEGGEDDDGAGLRRLGTGDFPLVSRRHRLIQSSALPSASISWRLRLCGLFLVFPEPNVVWCFSELGKRWRDGGFLRSAIFIIFSICNWGFLAFLAPKLSPPVANLVAYR